MPLEVLDDERPQYVFRGVVALSPLGIACGELLQIPVDCRKDLGIVVQDLTDRAVSVTIVAYDLGQPIVIGLKAQHGFLLSTHPCSPMIFVYSRGVRFSAQVPSGSYVNDLCSSPDVL